MFDNICNIPLTSELFTQAIHPSEPLLSVGLASGHVQTYRLPHALGDGHNLKSEKPKLQSPSANGNGTSQNGDPKSIISHRSRRLSEDGFDMVDTAWKTRRHKGSCRALAFSLDGSFLYSAGTDGIVKVAATETGRVTTKVALPRDSITSRPDDPSILHILSPQSLLLGTDSGQLHVYDLREPAASPSAQPNRTIRPHATQDDPSYSEPLTSLVPLPPTAASTSGTSKSWVTTSGSTLAVSDLRKGVIAVSEDQGDVLLSSAILSTAGQSLAAKKRKLHNGATAGGGTSDEVVVVGGVAGVLTLWERGDWVDQKGRIVLDRQSGPFGDEGTIDSLAIVPERVGIGGFAAGAGTIAAGTGNGTVVFTKTRGGGGESIGEVVHDEMKIESVMALGFDVGGRMISGGGQIVKVWHDKMESNGSHDDEEAEDESGAREDAQEVDHENDSGAERDSESDEAPKRKKKKRKRNQGVGKHGHHGIMAFEGLD